MSRINTKELSVQIPDLDEYLVDPIKRHTLVSDLPADLRQALWQDKRYIKQIEQQLFTLCGFGLLGIGKNPDPRRYNFAGCVSALFFILFQPKN